MSKLKFKKIVYFLSVLCFIFLVLEFSVRLFLFCNDKGFFRSRRFISPWFTSYDSPPPQEKDGFLYFKRGQVTTKIPPPNTIRIICLGGSTTVSAGTKNHYPAVLQKKLNEFYKNVKFEVLNAGGDGFSSAHHLVNFTLRLLYYHPDGIIIYENINDLSANYFYPSVDTDYTNKYLNNLFLAPECKLGFQKYFFKSRFLSYLLMKFNNFIFESRASTLNDSLDISLGKSIFRTNLINIIAIAKEHNIKVIIGTQAACFKYNNKFPYIRKKDFCEYNNVIQGVAKEYGVTLVNCFSALEEKPEYFMDLVHYTEGGIEKLATVFFEEIPKIYPDVKKERF